MHTALFLLRHSGLRFAIYEILLSLEEKLEEDD